MYSTCIPRIYGTYIEYMYVHVQCISCNLNFRWIHVHVCYIHAVCTCIVILTAFFKYCMVSMVSLSLSVDLVLDASPASVNSTGFLSACLRA